ncbi:MAG: hypothetical protein Q4G18_13070 [Myroides sp.]|nr:hypothetical protein [Myroides sp.]
MKSKFFYVLPLMGVLACSDDFSETTEKIEVADVIQEGLVGKRFFFSSSESLSQTIEEMRDNEELLERQMKTSYAKGFRSLSPIGDIENDRELINIFAKDLGEDIDDDDDIILDEELLYVDEDKSTALVADPVFASFVNEDNEIVVKDSLYKFTEKGVFSSMLKDSLKLYSYLESIKNEILSEEQIMNLRETSFGRMQVSDGVTRFIAPISEIEKNSLQEKTSETAKTDPVKLQEVINGLPQTRGKNNWILQRIGGPSIVSEEYFDKRHRVKLEFWNQNFGVYKSVGISVRNQTRRLRVWWASKADEVALGVNYIHLKYRMPTAPMPKSYIDFNSKSRNLAYIYNGKIYNENIDNRTPMRIVANYVPIVEKVELPFFKFSNEDILNIYIPKIPIVGGRIDYTLQTSHILSQSNIKKLYTSGFKFLKDLAPNKTDFVVVKENQFENDFEVAYFSERYQATGTNKIKKHFHKDFSLMVGLTFKSVGGSSFDPNINIDIPDIGSYKALSVDFYGMARRGNTWKGARLVF